VIERELDSVGRLLELVAEIRSTWASSCIPEGIWFRGHRESAWKLSPSAYRGDAAHVKACDSAYSRWAAECNDLLVPAPRNEWEWLYAAQHYGIPTRLLDWSESPLTAAYFAVWGDKFAWETTEARDPEIWVLSPGSMMQSLHGFSDAVLPEPNRGFSDAWLPHALSKVLEIPDPDNPGQKWTNELPIALHPPRLTERIRAQTGKFTAHGVGLAPLEKILSDECSLARLRITNPKRIGDELNNMVMHKGILFPEPAVRAAWVCHEHSLCGFCSIPREELQGPEA